MLSQQKNLTIHQTYPTTYYKEFDYKQAFYSLTSVSPVKTAGSSPSLLET